jgi:monoglucosyldiacylglycerol epimerase
MSSRWIAWAIIALAKRDFRDIIITINPLTYLIFPVKEFCQSCYFRLFTKNAAIVPDLISRDVPE